MQCRWSTPEVHETATSSSRLSTLMLSCLEDAWKLISRNDWKGFLSSAEAPAASVYIAFAVSPLIDSLTRQRAP